MQQIQFNQRIFSLEARCTFLMPSYRLVASTMAATDDDFYRKPKFNSTLKENVAMFIDCPVFRFTKWYPIYTQTDCERERESQSRREKLAETGYVCIAIAICVFPIESTSSSTITTTRSSTRTIETMPGGVREPKQRVLL